MIRSDLECKTRTNLPINHCAEMLTRTLRSDPGLFAQFHSNIIKSPTHRHGRLAHEYRLHGYRQCSSC
ncbi:hypothetical protein EI995_02670 [Streptococcus suis]|nr:hypothetical protein EI995_02670 [Streptococcus suis]RRR63875.1 hypothetical protein EI993_04725 [Streptococcus suis]